MKIAEIFGVTEGPLYEQMKHNILQVNGADHARLRGLVNPALSPRAVERYRPAMREFLEELLDARGSPTARGRGASLRVRGGVRQALPVAGDRDGDGRAAGGRAAAAPLVELDPAPVRRGEHGDRAASGSSEAVEEFYEYAEALLRGAARRPRRRPDLEADRRRGGGRPAVEWSASTSSSTCSSAAWTRARASSRTRCRLLAEHPDQWARCAADPSLAAAAVEEALRYEPITPFTARILDRGRRRTATSTFPEGTVVMVCAFTGNRDLDDDAGRRSASTSPPSARQRGATAHVRRRRPLLPRRQPRARSSCRRRSRSSPQRMRRPRARRRAGLRGRAGIYGLAELPIRFSRA